jgi:DNA polymerase-3 subunit beta
MKKNELKITAEDIDFGGEARERIACAYNSDDLEIGFNATYLIDILSHIDSDEVVFSFSSSVKAAIITQAVVKENEDVLMLVMPMRLNV